jgi:hypothetical protein
MSWPSARVRVTLSPGEPDATVWRLTNPSQTLVFRFRTGTSEELMAGAILDVDGGVDVSPGDSFSGSLSFWAEEVMPPLRVGEPFDVWYGRDVGKGEVILVHTED